MLELQHDDAQVDLPGVANLLTERLNVRIVPLEEAALQEVPLVGSEDVLDPVGSPVVLVDPVEVIDVATDVLGVGVLSGLVRRLERPHLPQLLIDVVGHVGVEGGHEAEALLVPRELCQSAGKLRVRSVLLFGFVRLSSLLPPPPSLLASAQAEGCEGLVVADYHCKENHYTQ